MNFSLNKVINLETTGLAWRPCMHQLTKDGKYKLRIDMQALNGTWYWEEYDTFIVQDRSTNYTMNVFGVVGNTGSYGSLTAHSGYPFSTKDSDISDDNCASFYRSGWWYHSCFHTCLNCGRVPDNYFIVRFSADRSYYEYLLSASMMLVCKDGTKSQY